MLSNHKREIDSLIEKGAIAQQQTQLRDHETARKELENISFHQDIQERKTFAKRAFYITVTWVGFLIVLTGLQFFLHKCGFGLSDISFDIVFSTTTASVFGFWYLVGKYLFNSKQ